MYQIPNYQCHSVMQQQEQRRRSLSPHAAPYYPRQGVQTPQFEEVFEDEGSSAGKSDPIFGDIGDATSHVRQNSREARPKKERSRDRGYVQGNDLPNPQPGSRSAADNTQFPFVGLRRPGWIPPERERERVVRHIGHLSQEARESVFVNELKDVRSNRPRLDKTGGADVAKFLGAYDLYVDRLQRLGERASLRDCIKMEVLSHLKQSYRIDVTDNNLLEDLLRRISKDLEAPEKNRVMNKLMRYRWPNDRDVPISLHETASRVEEWTANLRFHREEEKAICKMFLKRLPSFLFENGSDFVYAKEGLWTFQKLVEHLRKIPGTLVDLNKIAKLTGNSRSDYESRKRDDQRPKEANSRPPERNYNSRRPQ